MDAGSGVPDLSGCFQLVAQYPTCFTGSGQSHAIFGFDFCISHAPLITVAPANRRLDHHVGLRCRFEQGQSQINHLLLHRFVTRNAEWITKREIGKQESRYRAVSDDIQGRADDDGRDTVFFESSRGQTHGLMADGSERDEEGDISAVFPASLQYFRRIAVQCAPLTVLGGYAVETGCQ